MWLEEECQQLADMAAEHLEYKGKNWEKATYKAEEQMKKEEDATLPLEEARTQAQLLNLIRYVAINQRVKLIFSSVITTHLYAYCQPIQKYLCSKSSISVVNTGEHCWYLRS